MSDIRQGVLNAMMDFVGFSNENNELIGKMIFDNAIGPVAPSSLKDLIPTTVEDIKSNTRIFQLASFSPFESVGSQRFMSPPYHEIKHYSNDSFLHFAPDWIFANTKTLFNDNSTSHANFNETITSSSVRGQIDQEKTEYANNAGKINSTDIPMNKNETGADGDRQNVTETIEAKERARQKADALDLLSNCLDNVVYIDSILNIPETLKYQVRST